MKKRFKKIYVEITNKCNLNCSFCSTTNRTLKDMTVDEFKIVVSKIKKYTDYIYLHIKGEPLLHSNLDRILDICDKEKIKVNITTNGTLIKEKYDILNNHTCIRQLNISLHSENNKKNYFLDCFTCCKSLSTKMFISYRIWTLNNLKIDDNSTNIVDKIISFYKLSSDTVNKIYKDKSIEIDNNTFINKDNIFIWPNINNNLNIDKKCYGLTTHIGILSDGTIVPCCLDAEGIINLGNIFKDDLDSILNSELVKSIIFGFKNNRSICSLCKNCNFRERFTK